MSNRKSSITAELRLSGAQGFKNGLTDVGNSASKLGKQLQAIKPISFDGGANLAKRSWALTEEHQRAHHRVMQRQAKQNSERLAAYQKAGLMGGSGGKAGGGSRGGGAWGAAGNLSQGYNFVQDAAQGGIRGVANNIPWLIDAVASSTKVASLVGGIAAAASVGLAAKMGYDLFQNTGDRQADTAGTRHAINKMGADRRQQARERGEGLASAGARGDAASETQAGRGRYADSAISGVEEDFADAAARQQEEAKERMRKINTIEDLSERSKAAGEEEKRQLDELLQLDKRRAAEVLRIANAEKEKASADYRALDAELKSLTNASKTRAELEREVELNKELVGVKIRIAEANERANKALGGVLSVRGQEQANIQKKKNIDAETKADLERIERQKREDEREGESARNQEIRKYREMKKEADTNLQDQEKNRQTIRDQIKQEEEMAGLSPRKRAKAEEEEKKKARIESLKKEGFTTAEAADIAGREAKLAKPRGNRIRGAGYGREDGGMGGLGSESYGGLSDLAAMQPNRPERRTITGAGAKQKEQTQDKPETGWAMLVKAVQAVEKAVKDAGPQPSERGKPISTTSR